MNKNRTSRTSILRQVAESLRLFNAGPVDRAAILSTCAAAAPIVTRHVGSSAVQTIRSEIADFQEARRRDAAEARQLAALQLVCGIDLAAALSSSPAERARIAARIARRLRRERQKGLARHWSYDLNRHIALKQALDRLAGSGENEKGGPRTALSPVSGSALSASGACVRGPSSWRAASAPPRSSARPSDSSGRDPTSRDILPASGRNGS